MKANEPTLYAPVTIKLLQGILYQDDTIHWDMLLHHQSAVREYVGKIGLALYLDEGEGYAYLQQLDEETVQENFGQSLPRLIRRVKLSYDVTLLSVLFRERLQQFDASGDPSSRLVMARDDIREMTHPFFPEQTNEVRLLRNLDSNINQLVKLGFLKQLSGKQSHQYEVRRIIKAKISADMLADIKEKLQAHVEANS
ncbi:DUF4194 domain-containing protein [Anaerolineales bacterium HSG24]|nr:DUF4194 domain-containing protein [Anaerolineales bacterium HSG24]